MGTVTFTDPQTFTIALEQAAAPSSGSGSAITVPQYGTGTPSDPVNLHNLFQAADSGNQAAQQEVDNLERNGTISTGGAPLTAFPSSGGGTGGYNSLDQPTGGAQAVWVGQVRVGPVPQGVVIQAPSGIWVRV